jgi:hypothetical protein
MDDALNSLKTVPAFLREASYLPRVTRHTSRILEEALAPSTLFDQGVQLRGAIVEATYAAEDPLILRRLRSGSVPFLVEPQTLRFVGEAFLETKAFSELPYTPTEPITAETVDGVDANTFARRILEFEQTAMTGSQRTIASCRRLVMQTGMAMSTRDHYSPKLPPGGRLGTILTR